MHPKKLINRSLFLVMLIAIQAIGVINNFCVAQLPSTAPIHFSYLSVNDGLTSNTVRALMQDKYGFLWIGTNKGINRYDGHQVVSYAKTHTMVVTALYEVGDSIWIGTENGLYLYSQTVDSIICFKSNNKKISPSTLNISNICGDFDKNVWIATMNHGIVKISNKGVLEKVATPNDDNVYGGMCVDHNGDVWAVTNWSNNGLVRYDRKRNAFVPFVLNFGEQVPVDYRSLSLIEGSDGKMWLATSKGSLICFDATKGDAVIEVRSENSGMRNVHSLAEITDGYFVLGADNGLMLYSSIDGAIRHHVSNSDERGALSDNFVYPIISDREEGTWIGTYYGGVNYYHPTSSDFVSYVSSPHANSVSGNVINHFCEDKFGRIWIASDDGGLSLYTPDTKQFKKVTLSDNDNVHALTMLGDNLFVGTYAQGLYVVDINTLSVKHIPAITDIDGNRIDLSSFDMFVDNKSRLWAGTFDAICLFEPNTYTFKVMKKVGSPVVDIIQTKNGEIWVATEASGVWAYSDKSDSWKQYLADKHDKTDMKVVTNSIYQDTKGTIWAGTSDGLLKYDIKSDRFVASSVTSPTSVESITGQGDVLWLATNKGLCKFSISEEKVLQVFKSSSYFVSTDFLPAAIMCTRKGEIYVGTTHGFVSFQPLYMHHNEVVPKVVFTGLEVLNRPVAVGSDLLPKNLNQIEELRLSYRENVIRVSFSAMSYLQPSDNVYSYYLEGFDEEWVNAGSHHSVTYTNLAPGTYVLHVRATNNDGLLSEETTLRIVITPPFYWNTTAQIVYLLLILAFIYYVVRRIIKKTEKRHVEEIQEINIQKEQEIQEINIQKEQEIKEIHTQKEQAIQELNTQKEQEIQEINIQKEQEVHDARIKFMTITPRDQEFLDKLEDVIEKNFSNPDLTVDQIASAIGISRTGLFTKLKSLADVTPNEMIQVIRLKHAAALLQENRYRVSEVCYMVGFSSPSYFSKCFQKQYGVTPAKFV